MDPQILQQARSLMDTIRVMKIKLANRVSCCRGPGDGLDLELSFPQVNMLTVVRERGQVTIKALAEALNVSAPSASAMVDRLVEMGALTREHSKQDRREVCVRISETAAGAIEKVERQMLEAIIDLLQQMGPEYAQKWCEVYERIREILTAPASSKKVSPEPNLSRINPT